MLVAVHLSAKRAQGIVERGAWYCLSVLKCKERGAALSVGGKQPWAGLSWMCVGTGRHLRRFNHYRHYPPIMQIPLLSFMQRPVILYDSVWAKRRRAFSPISGVELSPEWESGGWKSFRGGSRLGPRILYLRPGLDPPASVDGGVLPAPLYRKERWKKTTKKILSEKKFYLLSFFWKKYV